MLRWVSILLFALAACSGPLRSTGGDRATQAEVEPQPAPQLTPEVWAGPASLEVGGQLAWAYQRAARAIKGVEPDRRLANAADTLLKMTSGQQGAPRRAQRQEAALRAGIAEPVPLTLLLRAGESSGPALEEQLGEQLSDRCQSIGCNRVGIAQTVDEEGRTDRLLVLAMRSGLTLDPVPLTVSPGQTVHLRGRLAEGSHTLEILAASPEGRVSTLFEGEASTFEASFEPQMVGPHRFEILATLSGSPTVLALFPVCVGCRHVQPAPAVPEGETTEPARATERIIELVNQSREQAGLSALRPLLALSKAASDHARSMAEGGFFSHRDPDGRGPGERAQRAGVTSELVLEDLSVAPTAELAFASILESPAHLRALLDSSTTHLGVGVSPGDDGALRVVVMMARVAENLDPTDATRQVVDAIGAARQARESPELELPGELREAADRIAEILARLEEEGLPEDRAADAAREELASRDLPAVRAVFLRTVELSEAAGLEPILDPTISRAGIAARPAADPSLGYYVVVLLAR